MLFSITLIILIGLLLSYSFQKLKLPGILGMLITGIILGPYMLNAISPKILDISAELRKIALIIILTRAGLSLNIEDLKKVGRPAVLMCFIPATFEIIAIVILGPKFLGISYIEAAIMGAVLAAVSPAVIVPRMLKLMDGGYGYGKKNNIPQLIMAGASVDDIFVIVLFTSFLNMYKGESFSLASLLSVPVSIVLGTLLGIISGLILINLFKKFHMRDTIKVLIILSVAFAFVSLEDAISNYISISGLIGVMALGATILQKYNVLAKRISLKFNKLWVGAEIFLFVLVGATVNINYIGKTGILAVLLIFCALIFRLIGVFICLIKTSLSNKEKLFCAISYIPKATVQAAIGSIPLASGVASGELILTVAVLSIIITAPLGAISMDYTYKKLLI